MKKMPDRVLCYCFGFTAQDIEDDVRANRRSTILTRIVAARQAGGCQCAEKNPSGR